MANVKQASRLAKGSNSPRLSIQVFNMKSLYVIPDILITIFIPDILVTAVCALQGRRRAFEAGLAKAWRSRAQHLAMFSVWQSTGLLTEQPRLQRT